MGRAIVRPMSVRSFLSRLFGGAAPVQPVSEDAQKGARLLDFSTHNLASAGDVHAALDARMRAAAPKTSSAYTAMDGNGDFAARVKALEGPTIGEALYSWFASQAFIGHQMAAIIAQHWLVEKACAMPARDAIRQGFTVNLEGYAGEDQTSVMTTVNKASKKYRIKKQMEDWVRFGRIFGLRIAIFRVESTDPKYYERPFNIDAVTPGSFKGIVQVDPYWCAPELDGPAAGDPASPEFYEPTWWTIAGKRYHRSHLAIFRTSEPPDILKPMYLYGGVPVPQKIMERVYAAERTANEAPQLAMTKRLTVWNTDVAEILGNQEKFTQHMATFTALRDNYGVKINDSDDTMQQFDTTLSDLDEVIMTQYQIVAAAAGVPATKLLGTTPKGFNATGEYEEASYHEELETIQENDLTPFLDRYLEILMRSEVEPAAGQAAGTLHATVDWEPLDSPTAEEYANINKAKAETDNILVTVGAIDGQDVRNRIRTEKDSGYTGISAEPLMETGLEDDPLGAAIEALGGTVPGADPLADATAALTGKPAGGGDPLDLAISAFQEAKAGRGDLDAAIAAFSSATGLGLEEATAALNG